MTNKHKINGHIVLFYILILLCFFESCTPPPDIVWNFSKNEITGANKTTTTEKLNVDVYLDVTTSMKGFVSPSNTNYSNLLDDIEGSCQNTWKNTDIKFYKFGRSVQPISRNDFISGKTSPVMFSDPVLSTQTNFAEAVKKTDSKRVSILITDLFYKNSDVNIVVNSVKDYCFKNNVEVGLIGLNSSFNGIVGDVFPIVKVKGSRPLYVLVFGDKQNINLLFKVFKSKPYVEYNQFLLITNKPTESYNVDLIKDKKCKTVNKQSFLKTAWKDFGTAFNFKMKKNETEAIFNLTTTLTMNPYLPIFDEKNLKVVVFQKKAGMKDSIPANDRLILENLKYSGNVLKADVKLINTEAPGKYGYAVYFTFDNTVPLTMPKWITTNNTEVYAQGVNENKTLNLNRLLTDITSNHITYAQPKVAKFYIDVYKN